jgi:endonuclease/exonuclease/phosphatase family metal-dependent hydrolase
MNDTFKILTYNVHRGRSAFRKRDICAEVARVIDFRGADAVCLQEVWKDDGFAAHRLEPHLCPGRWPHRIFETTARFRQGHQGNALVSSTPIRQWSAFDISVPSREARGMLHAVIELPSGRSVHVFNVHFGLKDWERRAQLSLLGDYIHYETAPDEPLFVLGDFNDWRGELSELLAAEFGLAEVLRRPNGGHVRTFPSFLPLLSLDRIYYRNAELREAHVVRDRSLLKLSDHLPVEAEFRLEGEY